MNNHSYFEVILMIQYVYGYVNIIKMTPLIISINTELNFRLCATCTNSSLNEFAQSVNYPILM